MKKGSNTSADAAKLRRRAEARLREDMAKGAPGRTADDVQRLVHELQVHQIELEMQNEELRRSRAEVEAWLERYTELYDFAPVGYLTLGRGVFFLHGSRLSKRTFCAAHCQSSSCVLGCAAAQLKWDFSFKPFPN